jgi:3-hydroxybutyryl-CoA dehydratase
MIGKTIDEIKVGDTAEFTKTISEADIYMYAGVTGDVNPAHIDEVYASKTFFKTRIAHGMLLAGFISTVIGNRLPGNGTIYVKQEVNFLGPVRIGDTVTARAEVVDIKNEKNRVKLRTTCANQDGKTVVDGEALVSPPKDPKRSG